MSGYSVTVFVDTTGFGHTFIRLDSPDHSTVVGYYPDVPNSPVSVFSGVVLDNTGHDFTYSSGPIAISQEQYDAMMARVSYIATSDTDQYGVVGFNCTGFVRDVLTIGAVDYPLGWGPAPASLIRYPVLPNFSAYDEALMNSQMLSLNAEYLEMVRTAFGESGIARTSELDAISQFAKDAAQGAKDLTDSTVNAATDVREAAADLYRSTVDTASGLIKNLVETYQSSVDYTADKAAAFYKQASDWVAGQAEAVATVLGQTVQEASDLGDRIRAEAQRAADDGLAAFKGVVGDLLDRLSNAFGVPGGNGDSYIADLSLALAQLFRSAEQSLGSPIVLDLNGDGVITTGIHGGAYFDNEGDGFAKQTAWVSPEDGLLAWDRNGNSRIDSGKELFGNQTILGNGSAAANGFEALAELDSNADGKIDANDPGWANLTIWKDADTDGYSTADELTGLTAAGVRSIGLAYVNSSVIDPNGNQDRQIGSFIRADGTAGSAIDVWFQRNPGSAVAEQWLAPPADIAALPDVKGMGGVYDLRQAMVRDSTGALQALVASFASANDSTQRNNILQSILYAWTGNETPDPTDYPGFPDGRKLHVLEKFLGETYTSRQGFGQGVRAITPTAVIYLNQAYMQVFERVYAELMSQTHLKSLYDLIEVAWDNASQSFKGELGAVATALANELATDPTDADLKATEFIRTVKGFNAEATLKLDDLRGNERLAWHLDSYGWSTLEGTAANDVINGTADNTAIWGGAGDDTIGAIEVGNSVVYGADGNDAITAIGDRSLVSGGSGDDVIHAAGQSDLHGDAGNDQIFVDYTYITALNGNLQLYAGEAVVDGGSGDDQIIFQRDNNSAGFVAGFSNTVIGGPGDDTLMGWVGADTYVFNRGDGHDTINDPQGADTISFGAGISSSDLIATRSGQDVILNINDPSSPQATDQITIQHWLDAYAYRIETFEFADGTTLGIAQINQLLVTGTAGNDLLTGWNEPLTYDGLAGDDTITAGLYDDTIYGGDGNDTIADSGGTNYIDGGAGNDTISVDDGQDTILGGLGNDQIAIGPQFSGTLTIDAGDGDDVVTFDRTQPSYSAAATNTSIGGQGNDTLMGGAGADTYVFNRGDGQDTVEDYNNYGEYSFNRDAISFGAGVAPQDVVASRNDADLVLDIGAAGDRITVRSWYTSPVYQIEHMVFAEGVTFDFSNLQIGSAAPDVLVGTSVNSFLLGDAGDDVLSGGAGNDLMNGGLGADSMAGGTGNDTYVVDDLGDIVTEYVNEGVDTVQSAIAYTLSATLENLTLSGTSEIDGTGNALDNVLLGNTANNVLTGGLGNDTYGVDNVGDVVVENAGEGIDTIRSSITYALGADLENLTLTGTAAIDGTGNALDNVLVGNSAANVLAGDAGDDLLDGGAGADTLIGNTGDDTYVVDDPGDIVIENVNEGIDTIQASVSFTIAANVESLVLVGASAINGSGNSSANTIIGNAGNNRLDGGGGTDTLAGGAGDDVYVVRDSSDIVIENADEGTDTVQASFSYTVGANVENLVLTGTNAVDGTGNTLANVLTGNSAANVLDGGAGADTLIGGQGNDTYVVDNSGDNAVENQFEGVDSVTSSVSYTLPANVENLTLVGGGATDGTGNTLGNIILGNSGDNSIVGGAGDDVLFGGDGTDILDGGSGADSYYFNAGNGQDVFRDLNGNQADIDKIILGTGITPENINVTRDANDLLIGSGGGADQIRVQDWYVSNNNQIEQLRFADGTVWDAHFLSLKGTATYGTSGDDILYGLDNQDDLIYGYAGNDALIGNSGNDLLYGGDGADTLIGGTGNDTLYGDAGDDVLDGGDGNDTLTGDVGNDVLDGGNASDLLYGGAGDDTLGGEFGGADYYGSTYDPIYDVYAGNSYWGGTGNDTLQGTYMADTYYFDVGDGQDVIIDSGNYRYSFYYDRIDLGAGIAPSDVSIGHSGTDLVLNFADGTDQLRIASWYSHVLGDTNYRIEQLRFADGAAWDANYLNAQALTVHGTAGDDVITGLANENDVIYGEAGNDALIGNSGNDLLYGGDGADTLIGGTGNDFLAAGAGNDTYVFDLGDGVDHVQDDTGVNTLQFGAGIDPSMLTLGLGSLLIHVGSGGDTIHLDDFDPGNVFGVRTIENFQFDDGTSLTYSQLVASGFDIFGTDGDDNLAGTNVSDRFSGGPGNDTYLFGRGSGQDQIEDSDITAGNSDTLRIGTGVGPNDLVISRAADDLLVSIRETLDQVAITNWFQGDANRIERVLFSDGTIWDAATLQGKIGSAPVNHAPAVVNPLNDQATNEDALYSFQLPADAFVDVDAGDTLTYSATLANGEPLPSWLSFDAATRSFAGTPDNADVGTLSVRVKAADSGDLSASDTFELTVVNINDAPTLDHPIAALATDEDALFAFAVPADTFSDVDIGDMLSYSAALAGGEALPDWLSFDAINRSFTGTPTNSDVGTLSVRITATDSGNLSVSNEFDLTVVNVNDAPTLANALADQDAMEYAPFSVQVPTNAFADVDVGDTLTYSATLADSSALPGWLAFDTATRTFSGTPARADVGTLNVNVMVTDSGNLSASDIFGLTIAKIPAQNLVGAAGNDVLTGGGGDDTLDGRGGSDRLLGNGGDDTFQYFADAKWTGQFVAHNEGSPGNPGTGKDAAIARKNRSYDVFQGGPGTDVLIGTSGDDALFLDDRYSPFPSAREPRLSGIERIDGGGGSDVIDLTSRDYGYGDVTLDGGDGNDVLWASAGNDVLFGGPGSDDLFGGSGSDSLNGGTGADTMSGGAGNDLLNGGAGADTLKGDAGHDVLEGMAGNDTLADTGGNNLFNGGLGADTMTGNSGNELFIGGSGNDTITPGTGKDIIAFNHGDGQDTINASTGADNTLSIGGGIRYADMSFTKSGKNLVLKLGGSSEKVTLTNWYAASPTNKSVLNLQVITQAMADFNASSADPLLNKKVSNFDFLGLASAFDSAGAPANWALTHALLAEHLSGSDTEALGGDLAYRYGLTGSLANVGFDPAVSILSNASFGTAAQAFQSQAALEQDVKRLS